MVIGSGFGDRLWSKLQCSFRTPSWYELGGGRWKRTTFGGTVKARRSTSFEAYRQPRQRRCFLEERRLGELSQSRYQLSRLMSQGLGVSRRLVNHVKRAQPDDVAELSSIDGYGRVGEMDGF